jgi:hypothetical protein
MRKRILKDAMALPSHSRDLTLYCRIAAERVPPGTPSIPLFRPLSRRASHPCVVLSSAQINGFEPGTSGVGSEFTLNN